MRNLPSTQGARAGRRWGMLINSLIVMLGYVLSRALGLVRDAVIAHRFGTSDAADAYTVAFNIPDLLYLVIIGGALGSAFIPIFSELWAREGEEHAWRLASEVMNLALIVLVAAAALVAIFARPLTGLLYGAYPADKQELIVDLLRLFLFSPLLLGLGGLAMAALNALDRYTLPALAPAFYNLSIIAGALFLAPTFGIYGVAYGVIGGALLYVLIQVPGLIKAGMRYSASLGLRSNAVRRVGRLMAPRIFGQSAAQIAITVTFSIAALLGEGRARALGQAYQLMLLPHGIFALSLGTVAFPAMARAFAAGDIAEVGRSMRSVLRVVLWTVVPAAVAMMVLAVPIVRLLFQRGEFGEESTRLVAGALLFYATALPAFAASEMLIRTFYALQDTRTPVAVGVATVALNIGLAVALVYGLDYGYRALAVAFSIANNLEALVLAVLLHRRLGGLDPNGGLRRSLRQTLVGATGMGVALLALLLLSRQALPWLSAAGEGYQPGRDVLLLAGWLALAGIVGLGVYLALEAMQGAEELQTVGGRLLRRVRS
ncbi:MAG: putative lipid II flippase MurJ [Herpetosiphonaceae bacterium]|nr:MAG: putative lipid II flippase MurJ [Herpetosiphonaceae bacterium]